jgi:phospholipid/cholesterol/gamma-HCH transport system substrate-binding protein
VLPGDGTAHFGLVLNADDPPACTRGYEGTQKTDPNRTTGLPALNTGARCAEPSGSAITVRGAQNAPAPRGSGAAAPVPTSYPLLAGGRVVAPGTAAAAPTAPVRVGGAPPGTSGADALTLLLLGGAP